MNGFHLFDIITTTKAFEILIMKEKTIMKINSIIKEKRLELNLTQEQLANHLGVSTPAVNKWEKGVSYPDITILPPLARLLKIDLNTLLSFNEDLTETEILAFTTSSFTNLNKESYKEIFEKCMDKIHEYPTCDKLILSIAMSLLGGLYILNIENKDLFEEKLNQLHHQCANSDDIEVKNQAIPFLIGKSIENKNYEKAQMYIDMLPMPHMICNRNQYQGGLYVATNQNDKALEVFEGNLLKLSVETYTVLNSMIGIALKENRVEDAMYLASVIKKATELYDMRDYSAESAYFEIYLHQKDEENMIDTLEKMLFSLHSTWSLLNTKLYSHIKKKETTSNVRTQFSNAILEMMKSDTDGRLAFVKENPRFIELIHKYSESSLKDM